MPVAVSAPPWARPYKQAVARADASIALVTQSTVGFATLALQGYVDLLSAGLMATAGALFISIVHLITRGQRLRGPPCREPPARAILWREWAKCREMAAIGARDRALRQQLVQPPPRHVLVR